MNNQDLRIHCPGVWNKLNIEHLPEVAWWRVIFFKVYLVIVQHEICSTFYYKTGFKDISSFWWSLWAITPYSFAFLRHSAFLWKWLRSTDQPNLFSVDGWLRPRKVKWQLWRGNVGPDTELPEAQSTHVWPCCAIHMSTFRWNGPFLELNLCCIILS